MLIGDSIPEYVFIRVAIWTLRAIAPASILYCAIVPVARPHLFFRRPWPLPLTVWAIAESSFFLLAYLPLRFRLQEDVVHPDPPRKEDRKRLADRVVGNLIDPELYISKWFLSADPAEIRNSNLEEFFAWSFLNKKPEDLNENEAREVELIVDRFEERLGREIQDGRGEATSLRGTFDAVPIQHRPLVWYMIVSSVDSFVSLRLRHNSFSLYRPSLANSIAIFPPRPLSFCTLRTSPAPQLSYWYRKHTSKKSLPVLFLHGIGVGLYTYVDFLLQLNSKTETAQDDGEIGIIAIEILPISARICPPALRVAEMREQIAKILDAHVWDEVVLVGHSYGTAISASFLTDKTFSTRVKAAVLMDPICFQLHLPDISYNFTRRKPSLASEHMLHYFSSQDPLISHTIARRFFWSEYILWNEDIADMPLTVVLSGRDIIVPTKAVWNYLTDSSARQTSTDGMAEWQGESLRVVWFDGFNHAGLFQSRGGRRGAAKMVREYCAQYGHAIEYGSINSAR